MINSAKVISITAGDLFQRSNYGDYMRYAEVDLSIAAASRLIDAKLDGEANRRLVTEYLESLSQGSTR